MENFEKVLKKELGIFEKHFVDFTETIKNEMSNFKNDMKNEMSDFKNDMRNEMSDFKTEMKQEMSDFKTEMKQEMSDFKTEVRDEIRDRFFVFEQEYGKKIEAMHDIIVLNKEKTDERIENLEKQVKTNEMRIIKNSLDIDSLKFKKVDSKTKS